MTLEKLSPQDGQSLDLRAENIAKLKQLFPEILSEKGIDFGVLKQLLGEEIEEGEERYSFTWNGKARARRLAQTPSTGTLRPCKEESKDWDTTQNLFIEGDNLEVLKLLQKSYHQKVKMIYIDPPYNTGKDFVYSDDFRDNIANYLSITGQTDIEGRKFSVNSETSGRYHSNWLNMIYPRLRLARNLLKEDGVIFISIDDSEYANLRSLCDEIFGEDNFVATLVWEKGRKNDAKFVSIGHEYILVFAKNKGTLTKNGVKWREVKPGAKEILDEYLRLRGLFGANNGAIEEGIRNFYDSLPKSHISKKHSRYNKVDDRGIWRDDNMSWPGGGGPTYDLIHPITKIKCVVPEGGWRYGTLEKMEEMIRTGKVVFREDHSEPPIKKTYLVEIDEEFEDAENLEEPDDSEDDLPIQVAGTYFYRSALQASNELNQIFGKKVFNNPKDREVLARWISYINPSQGDIVLDFFAGSGTTAHAVMALNESQRKDIRFILVQLPEAINQKAKGAKPAFDFLSNLGKPVNVAELTKERLLRTSQLIGSNAQQKLDLGFRVFKLAASNIKSWDAGFDSLSEDLLNSHEVIKPQRTADDVLFEILLKYGLDLSLPVVTHSIAGRKIFDVGGGALLVCLDADITETVAEAIGQLKATLAPAVCRVVFRDSSFADDAAKVNAVQVLKQFGIEDVKSL